MMRTLSGTLLGHKAKDKSRQAKPNHHHSGTNTKSDSNSKSSSSTRDSYFHKFFRFNLFGCSTSLKYITFTAVFFTATFFFHMFLQNEYYKHCKSNVFRVVLFNESYMCTHMANVLNLIETSYIVSAKRFIRTAFGIWLIVFLFSLSRTI